MKKFLPLFLVILLPVLWRPPFLSLVHADEGPLSDEEIEALIQESAEEGGSCPAEETPPPAPTPDPVSIPDPAPVSVPDLTPLPVPDPAPASPDFFVPQYQQTTKEEFPWLPLGIGSLLIGCGLLGAWWVLGKGKEYEQMVEAGKCKELEKLVRAKEKELDRLAQEKERLKKQLGEEENRKKKLEAKIKQLRKDIRSLKPKKGRSFVESEGIKLTEGDLGLRRKEAKRAWNKYQKSGGGLGAAQKLEQEWEELGEHQALTRLRREEKQARAKRKAELRGELQGVKDERGVLDKTILKGFQAGIREVQSKIGRLEAELDGLRKLVKECHILLKERKQVNLAQQQTEWEEHQSGEVGKRCKSEVDPEMLKYTSRSKWEVFDPSRKIRTSYPGQQFTEEALEGFYKTLELTSKGMELIGEVVGELPGGDLVEIPMDYWEKVIEAAQGLTKYLKEKEGGIGGHFNHVMVPIKVYQVTTKTYVVCVGGRWKEELRGEIKLVKEDWRDLVHGLMTAEHAPARIEEALKEFRTNEGQLVKTHRKFEEGKK